MGRRHRPPPDAPGRDPGPLLARGRSALDAYEYPEARAAFEEALAFTAGDTAPAKALLELLVEHLGLDAEALAVLPRLSTEARGDETVRRQLALAAARTGDDKLARGLVAAVRQPEAAPVYWALGRQRLTRGELDAVPPCVELMRELDPSCPGIVELERELAAARDRERAAREAELEAMIGRAAPDALSAAARALLALWPDSAVAAGVLRAEAERARAEEERARAERGQAALEDARAAEATGDLERAVGARREALALGAGSMDALRQAEHALARARHQREVDAVAAELAGHAGVPALVRFWRAPAEVRAAARAESARPELPLLEALGAAPPGRAADERVREVRALLEAEARFAAGDLTAAHALLRSAPHVAELEPATRLRGELERQAAAAARAAARAALGEAELAWSRGDHAAARDRTDGVDGALLDEPERARLATVREAVRHGLELEQLRERERRASVARHWGPARTAAEELADRAPTEAERAEWAARQRAHEATLARACALLVAEGDVGPPTSTFPRSSLQAAPTLVPGGAHVIWASSHGHWVFLRWIDVQAQACVHGVALRVEHPHGLSRHIVGARGVELLSDGGEALRLALDGRRVLDRHVYELADRVEEAVLSEGRYLWATSRDSDECRVLDRDPPRQLASLGQTEQLCVAYGQDREVVLRAKEHGFSVYTPPGRRVATVGDEWLHLTHAALTPRGLFALESNDELLSIRVLDEHGRSLVRLMLEDANGEAQTSLAPHGDGVLVGYHDDRGPMLASVAFVERTLTVRWRTPCSVRGALVFDASGTRSAWVEWREGRPCSQPIRDHRPDLPTLRPDPELDLGWYVSEPWSEHPDLSGLRGALERVPPPRRGAEARRLLGPRPTAERVVCTATALTRLGSFDAAEALLREAVERDPSDLLLSWALCHALHRLADGEREALLAPFLDRLQGEPYGALAASELALVRLRAGDPEGALDALRAVAGPVETSNGADPRARLEAVYGETEPSAAQARAAGVSYAEVRRARALVRAMQEADTWMHAGDARAALARLDEARPAVRAPCEYLARRAEAWLALEPREPRELFVKLETMAAFVAGEALRMWAHLPVPHERLDVPARAALRARAEAWLDARCDPGDAPDWARELDAALADDRSEPERAPRLGWRLEQEGEAWRVRPQLQRPRGASGFTPGRRVEREDELHDVPLTAVDRAALRSSADPGEDALAELLLLLADHPGLVLEQRALDVRTARLVLVVREGPRREPSIAVRVGGTELSLDALRARLGERLRRLVDVDATLPRATVIQVTAVQRRILTALASAAALVGRVLERRLGRLGEHFDLDLSEHLRGPAVPADDRLVLLMRWTGVLHVEALVRPAPNGPRCAPGEGPDVVVGTIDHAVVHVRRHRPAERPSARARLAALELEPRGEAGPLRFVLPSLESALDILARIGRDPSRYVIEWEGAPLEPLPSLGAGALGLRVEAAAERWLMVDGSLAIDEARVTLGELLVVVRAGQRYVRVEDGRFAALEASLRGWLEALDAIAEERDGGLCVGAAALPWLAQHEGTIEGEAWASLGARLATSRDIALPPALDALLRPYQRAGVAWLARLTEAGLGGVLADDMGLGKTLQALALLVLRAPRGPALAVVPTSVLHPFADEARRFAPSLRVVVHHGAGRDLGAAALGPGVLVLTTYGVVVEDRAALAEARFATLVLDEAQQLKNPRSRRAGAVRALDAEVVVALTGTPLENRLAELWSLFSMVEPSLFGGWERFRRRFVAPIERDADPHARALLSRLLRPFVLRRTKADVLPELPPITTQTALVEPTEAERAAYEAGRARALEVLAGEVPDHVTLLTELTRLRQLACDARLVDPTSRVGRSKLEALVELLVDLRDAGRRALVFSQFVRLLELARAELEAAGLRCAILTGEMSTEARGESVRALQEGEVDVLCVSLKAGGTGLNLTAASTVVHLDPWWNPAVEDQASARAHRIGQTEPVHVVRLVMRGTIEEHVLALHESKRRLVEEVLEGTDAAGTLSMEELAGLLRHA